MDRSQIASRLKPSSTGMRIPVPQISGSRKGTPSSVLCRESSAVYSIKEITALVGVVSRFIARCSATDHRSSREERAMNGPSAMFALCGCTSHGLPSVQATDPTGVKNVLLVPMHHHRLATCSPCGVSLCIMLGPWARGARPDVPEFRAQRVGYTSPSRG